MNMLNMWTICATDGIHLLFNSNGINQKARGALLLDFALDFIPHPSAVSPIIQQGTAFLKFSTFTLCIRESFSDDVFSFKNLEIEPLAKPSGQGGLSRAHGTGKQDDHLWNRHMI